MPSLSLSSALLLVGNTEGLPWTLTPWQTITKVHGIPWFFEEDSADDSAAPNYPLWTVGIAKTVKTFAENCWALPEGDQDSYTSARKADNDLAGRTAWNRFIRDSKIAVLVNKVIDEVLTQQDRNPYQVLAQHNVRGLPSLEDSQVYDARLFVADALLGKGGYVENGTALRQPVKKFVNSLLALTWNRYRKSLGSELDKMTKSVDAIQTMFDKLCTEGYHPRATEIVALLREIRKATVILTKWQDKKTIELLEEWTTTLDGMLAAVRKDTSSEAAKKLPKPIREALEQLASEAEISEIASLIKATLENIQSDTTEQVELTPEPTIDIIDWKEGIEELKEKTEKELWVMLGLPNERLPFFQEWMDPHAIVNPWSKEGQEWLKNPDLGRVPLKPRWHQLVRIYRLLEQAFEGKPVLLMDGVGLGKTMQAIGAIACLSYYRTYFDAKGDYPGNFAKRRFNSADGLISDLPHIVVCPVNLKDQWDQEIKRYLQQASFDIFPYLGRSDHRANWWDGLYKKSSQPLGQRIILATYTAIQDDATQCFRPGQKNEAGRGIKLARYESIHKQTLYGLQFGFMFMDEAHSGRKYNITHLACRELRKVARALVAMTATPVTTKAQDLWIVGDMLSISGFDNREELLQMNRELNAASRHDSKVMREAGMEGSHLRGTLVGKVNKAAPKLEFRTCMRNWMKVMCDRFASHVIRRTIDSLDYRHQKLFGMRPYIEHFLTLRMYDWEMTYLRRFAQDIVKDNPMATAADTHKHFYIEFRRSMLHPRLNPKYDGQWAKPASLQHWKDSLEKTVKLDVLAEVVLHHLERDGQQPVQMNEDGKTLQPNTDHPADQQEYAECDRIVVYSAFPSSNAAMVDIFSLYGIAAIELNGSMTTKKRVEALNTFRASTRETGPRVLILSNVSVVGLNLACANIMVIVDTTWSALDDEQLRGRIFRYPQQKQVHIYRLIALGTPDIFLNNMSFDKGELHSAFIGTDPVFRDMFDIQDDELLSVPEHEPTVGTHANEGRARTKPKAKAKAKAKAGTESVSVTRPAAQSNAMSQDISMVHIAEEWSKGKQGMDKPKETTAKAKPISKGKGKAKAPVNEEDDPLNSIDDDVDEPAGRNKSGMKKSRLRSPEPGTKRRQSIVSSPTSPSKNRNRKRIRQDTIGGQETQAPRNKDRAPPQQIPMGVDMLSHATMHLSVRNSSGTHTPNVGTVAQDDSILAALSAPGGQNDPEQDEEIAMAGLHTPERPADVPALPSSPLTPVSSQMDSVVAYTIPHRPVGPSTTRAVPIPGPHPAPLPLIGGAHTGSLAKNRDGSGNTRGKPRSKRPQK